MVPKKANDNNAIILVTWKWGMTESIEIRKCSSCAVFSVVPPGLRASVRVPVKLPPEHCCSIWVPLPVPYPVQPHAQKTWKAAESGSGAWIPASTWEVRKKLRSWLESIPAVGIHLGSELAKKDFFLYLSPGCNFWINKIFIKSYRWISRIFCTRVHLSFNSVFPWDFWSTLLSVEKRGLLNFVSKRKKSKCLRNFLWDRRTIHWETRFARLAWR